MKEKRRDERTPYDACLQYAVQGDDPGKLHNCVAVDISAGGMGIMSSSPIKPGQLIRVETQNAPARNAVVQWNAPVGVNYRIGLLLF